MSLCSAFLGAVYLMFAARMVVFVLAFPAAVLRILANHYALASRCNSVEIGGDLFKVIRIGSLACIVLEMGAIVRFP